MFDNLARAQQHAEQGAPAAAIAEGLRIVQGQLDEALARSGVERVPTVGRPWGRLLRAELRGELLGRYGKERPDEEEISVTRRRDHDGQASGRQFRRTEHHHPVRDRCLQRSPSCGTVQGWVSFYVVTRSARDTVEKAWDF